MDLKNKLILLPKMFQIQSICLLNLFDKEELESSVHTVQKPGARPSSIPTWAGGTHLLATRSAAT